MSHTTLEPEIREIQEKIQTMMSENYADKLLEIIHRTGWTETQAHLVRVILNSVVHQLEGIERGSAHPSRLPTRLVKSKSGNGLD